MRGCSSKQYGGAQPHASSAAGGTIDVHIPPHADKGSAGVITEAAKAAANASILKGAGTPAEYKPTTQTNTAVPAATGQKGGYKSKHRRRRYKKSIGRKGRSKRFRGSRK